MHITRARSIWAAGISQQSQQSCTHLCHDLTSYSILLTHVTLAPPVVPQLSYTELYDLDGCCAFVADFIAFEPLEDPLHPPEYLPSPMSSLSWQVSCRSAGKSCSDSASTHGWALVRFGPTTQMWQCTARSCSGMPVIGYGEKGSRAALCSRIASWQ
jgi:hypothetical protein